MPRVGSSSRTAWAHPMRWNPTLVSTSTTWNMAPRTSPMEVLSTKERLPFLPSNTIASWRKNLPRNYKIHFKTLNFFISTVTYNRLELCFSSTTNYVDFVLGPRLRAKTAASASFPPPSPTRANCRSRLARWTKIKFDQNKKKLIQILKFRTNLSHLIFFQN